MKNRPVLSHLDEFKTKTFKGKDHIYIERVNTAKVDYYILNDNQKLARNIGHLEVGRVNDRYGNELDIFSSAAIKILISEFDEKPVTEMLNRKLVIRINDNFVEDQKPKLFKNFNSLDVGRINDRNGNELDIFSPAAIKILVGQFDKKSVTEMLNAKLTQRVKNQIAFNLKESSIFRMLTTNDSPIYGKKNVNPHHGQEKDCMIKITNEHVTINPIIENFNQSEFHLLQDILGGELGVRSSNCHVFEKDEAITSITLSGNGAQLLLNEIESAIYNKRLSFNHK